MSHALRLLSCLTVLGAGIGLVASFADDSSKQADPEEIHPRQVGAQLNPARVEGHAACVDCHKLEVKAWLASSHATDAFDRLRDPKGDAEEIAGELGIRVEDIARKSICLNCHATRTVDLSGRPDVIGGVSCEACHGESGGETGWLHLHAVYGPPGTRRAQETDKHHAWRRNECRQDGQAGSSELYQLVKRCYQCHVIGDESLVEAGHPADGNFVLIERMSGEVRHNFLLDKKVNAEVASLWTDPLHHGKGRTAAGRKRVLAVLEPMIDIEICLRNLAAASEENDLTDAMFDRIEDAFELLAEDILEELEDTELPEVKQAVEAVEPVWEMLDDDGFNPDDKKAYLAAAEEVASAAKTLAARDGNKLAEIDELDLIPEGPFDDVFQP